MQKSKLAVLAILFCAGTAVPALAAWDQVGSVNIDFRRDRDTHNFDFGGPVDRLQLTADRGDIDCRSVSATFANGNAREIFRGTLRRGQPANIDLPGNNRGIRRLNFACGARDPRGGVIRIAADIGSHRDEWRRNPGFDRTWGRVFNWGSNAVNNWQLIGSESFEGRGDVENSFTGYRGRGSDAIALKPLEADARCSRVSARFDRGRDQALNVNNGDLLRRGQYYKLDLPGNYRNLDSLTLRCSAVNARRVTIQIFTSH